MKYIAHKNDSSIQLLKDHLCNVAEIAGNFADIFDKKEWGYCCGMLHDIGKYSLKFQDKIYNDLDVRVDHSTAGARVCYEKGGLYQILEYCIAGHHSGLPNTGSVIDMSSDSTLYARRKKIIEDYSNYKDEIIVPSLNSIPFISENVKNPEYSLSVFIRMIYSCLVDADFLDTEYFMLNQNVLRYSGDNIEELNKRLDIRIKDWLINEDKTDTINGRRTEILKNCIANAKNDRGLFSLTVPTGGGKTVSSLAFALKHAIFNKMSRIIYVIPYTSVIEQNAKIFKDILGERNVLENHCNIDYDLSEEFEVYQLASENWDMPVIVTTNVQFFESLYSNKSSKCRKLHNIANSVIIFDEIQMLPVEYLLPCTYIIDELIRGYKCSAVLCTATQPSLEPFLDHYKNIIELCPRVENQFNFFKRVKYINIGTIDRNEFVTKLNGEENVLVVVNTRKEANILYKMLEQKNVYHLSTCMCPKHRFDVLNTIKTKLKNGEKCIVISTSLIEVGVDLDFDIVFRQISGLDSIIQAGGRCNREGKKDIEQSNVYIFDFEESAVNNDIKQKKSITKEIINESNDIASNNNIKKYFDELYRYKKENLDKKKILDEFHDSTYNFQKVSKDFRIIENDGVTIFIPYDDISRELIDEAKLIGVGKNLLRKLGKYSVDVYKNEFEILYGIGCLNEIYNNTNLYFLNDNNYYDENCGLKIELKNGECIFF